MRREGYVLLVMAILSILIFSIIGCGGGSDTTGVVPNNSPQNTVGATVTGTVYNETGTLVGKGCTVTLKNLTSSVAGEQITFTDADSRFNFMATIEGEYIIRAQIPGSEAMLYSNIFTVKNMTSSDVPVGYAPGPTGPTGATGATGATGPAPGYSSITVFSLSDGVGWAGAHGMTGYNTGAEVKLERFDDGRLTRATGFDNPFGIHAADTDNWPGVLSTNSRFTWYVEEPTSLTDVPGGFVYRVELSILVWGGSTYPSWSGLSRITFATTYPIVVGDPYGAGGGHYACNAHKFEVLWPYDFTILDRTPLLQF